MSDLSFKVPDELKNYLVVEDCSRFPIDRYVLTQSESAIAKSIVKMKQVVPQLREMNIDYLNATLLYGDPGTGKAQPLDSHVLTPDGFVEMREIKEGSSVITPTGETAKVAAIYPRGVKDTFDVLFDDGGKCSCSEDHLWEVQGPEERALTKEKGKYISRVMSLKDIKIELSGVAEKDRSKWFSIRNINPPEFETKEFKINPRDYGKAMAQKIVTGMDSYLTGDKEQRTQFLNSFIEYSGGRIRDGDGHLSIHFNEGEHQTAKFMVNMARSLGFKCVMRPANSSDVPGYNVRILRGDGRRYIKEIIPGEPKECQCIYINDPLHLYITDDYIVTHNTTFGRYMAYKLNVSFAFMQFANIMGGGMGDTSKNISKIFEFIKDKKCIFMMDEIDAISAKRGYESAGSNGELGRITITVMQELDKLKKSGCGLIIIAATNIPTKNMDEALVSRFPIVKKIRTWTNREKVAYIHKFLSSAGLPEDEEMIQQYVSSHSSLPQRGIEADIIRATAEWLAGGQKEFVLKHIREKDLD